MFTIMFNCYSLPYDFIFMIRTDSQIILLSIFRKPASVKLFSHFLTFHYKCRTSCKAVGWFDYVRWNRSNPFEADIVMFLLLTTYKTAESIESNLLMINSLIHNWLLLTNCFHFYLIACPVDFFAIDIIRLNFQINPLVLNYKFLLKYLLCTLLPLVACSFLSLLDATFPYLLV